jgi:hypothetical protein
MNSSGATRRVFVLALAAIFLFSALRPADLAEYAIVYAPLVDALKSGSVYAGIAGVAVAIFVFLRHALARPPHLRVMAPPAAILLLIYQIYYVLRQGLEFSFDERLYFALILLPSYFLLFSVILPQVLRSGSLWLDQCILALFLVGGVYIAVNVYQLAVNPSGVIWKGRLFGIANHPNFLGVACAHICICALGVALDAFLPKILRLSATAVTGGAVILLVLTGSRTAGLSLLSGLVVLLVTYKASRAGKLALIGALVLMLGYSLYIAFASNVDSANYERFYSSDDTRSELWKMMSQAFLADPFFGAGRSGGTANSYLRVLADTGLFGGVIFFSCLGALIASLYVRRRVALTMAFRRAFIIFPLTAVTLTGGVTEGYLLDFASLPLMFFYVEIFSSGLALAAFASRENQVMQPPSGRM